MELNRIRIPLFHRGRESGWEAFLADHTPPALDDKLKKVSYDALSKVFGMISPEQMLKAIPMTMPMTHLATIDGKMMQGIAKYPLDAWIAAGNPCFTSEKWAMMCLLLAEKGRECQELSAQDVKIFEELFLVSSTLQTAGPARP